MERKHVEFMIVFKDESIPGRFMTSYCLNRQEALAQVQEIFWNEILNVVLYREIGA